MVITIIRTKETMEIASLVSDHDVRIVIVEGGTCVGFKLMADDVHVLCTLQYAAITRAIAQIGSNAHAAWRNGRAITAWQALRRSSIA